MIALLFNLFASWMLALLAGASMAMAQSTVSGKVLDPHGVPVAEACVSLLNVAGSSVREATTDEQGGFALNKIGAGVYELMAQQAAIVSRPARPRRHWLCQGMPHGLSAWWVCR
jgi:hypothetical protein